MKIVNLIGLKFGKLLVIELLSSKRSGSKVWLCKCDCGNTKEVTTRHLNRKTSNTIKSCGCLSNRKGKENPCFKGFEGISQKWFKAHITRENSQTARVRVPVNITKEYLWKLFLKQDKKCALSNINLILSNQNNTASVDRIDSSLGYIEGNVQFVHKDINMMKRNYDQNYFINLCKLVSLNNK